ncbi:transposase [Acinetobacter junii]|uniref:Transposase n=1 Tax=Acinetobacter junii TaxID=40215 RepID=A0AAW5R8J2_ACIJU|nr:transposase [Acinetobacter junii]
MPLGGHFYTAANTYSPDFNPIERAWSVLKSKVRHMVAQDNRNLPQALDIAFNLM